MGKSYDDWKSKQFNLNDELNTLQSSFSEVKELINFISIQIEKDLDQDSGDFIPIIEDNSSLFTALCNVCDAAVAFDPYKLIDEGVYDPNQNNPKEIEDYHKATENLERLRNNRSGFESLLQGFLKMLDIITSLGFFDGWVTQYKKLNKALAVQDEVIYRDKRDKFVSKLQKHQESFETAKDRLIDEVFQLLDPEIKKAQEDLKQLNKQKQTHNQEGSSGIEKAQTVKSQLLDSKIKGAENQIKRRNSISTEEKEKKIRDKLKMPKRSRKTGPKHLS